eukprot:CAMPEP_0179301132 /NCGR_PEP_ID=MMETSP0797-20121207/47397_1 /TAXON_ID=47934 /ORGANISM="Dinophysis acuminata, Strain DAEP01" /LENGTH=367 /DNA_ID=CAMNT_0021010633 /DNA_START=358 /DNA_END=1461 /DNA_ORIENTATION=+
MSEVHWSARGLGTPGRASLVVVPVRVLRLPAPGAVAHVLERSLRRPAEVGPGFGGVGDDAREVAGAAPGDPVRDRPPRGLLEGPDHLEDGVPLAGAQVVHEAAAARAEDPPHRADVAVGEVLDVDVVAHARAVRRVPVVPEDADALALADGDLLHVGHEVVRDAPRALADLPGGVGPDRVEVAEERHAELRVGRRRVHEDPLDHVLRPAVRVRAAQGPPLVDRLLARLVDRRGRREDDPLAPVLAHGFEEIQGCDKIVLVVPQGLLDGLANGLQSREVDHAIKLLLPEQPVNSFGIACIDVEEWDILTRDLLQSSHDLRTCIHEVVQDADLTSGFKKLDYGVGTNVSRTPSAANVFPLHGTHYGQQD